eukprot:CAMPEP_0195032188 /NCGR_PEP_ID=MMETSP0326_2-20130528/62917_1 /TAXON_ID=2866 ORGANISM="Crypthecodinium cohnii, Strain Seligo" /NCGR_SAMPLE_ID=MMETSP0326_2 /ASSEMBLY_ACC=CAM_ASM_000348 /LENGTH=70 /DNA_ID=CAMNT_0040056209 /DNA_START=180 /DNA_END=388 /DNA_ORIENTATION=-
MAWRQNADAFCQSVQRKPITPFCLLCVELRPASLFLNFDLASRVYTYEKWPACRWAATRSGLGESSQLVP